MRQHPKALLVRIAVVASLVAPAARLAGHPHDPAYMKGASERILRVLESPEGRAVVDRAAIRMAKLTLATLPAVDREVAMEIARELVPLELQRQVCNSGMVEEVGEILLTWGRDEEPDEASSARILGESLPTIQVVRVLRARYRRRFRIDPTEGSMPPPGPIRAGGPPGTKPLLPDDDLARKRDSWIRDIIAKPLPAAPVPLPITRFDADRDGYAETCGLDADFDGRPDRFEADLDGDRVMETSFLPRPGGWVAEDTPIGRAARDAAMRNPPGSPPGEEPSGPAGKAGGPAILPGAPPEPPGPSVPPPPGEEARRQG